MLSWLLLLAAGSASPEVPRCTALDYKELRGGCRDGKRERVWIRDPRPEVWDCEGRENISLGNTTCDCTINDFEPLTEPERNGRVKVESWSVKTDENGVPVCSSGAEKIATRLPTGSTLRKCRIPDLGFEYTKCDGAAMSRNLISYWKTSCDPNGAVEVREMSKVFSDELILVTRSPLKTPISHYILLEPNASRPILKEVGPGLAELYDLIGQELLEVDSVPFVEDEYDPSPLAETTRRSVAVTVQLPPARSLPCHMQCQDGMYLSPPMRSCAFCPKGTHSVHGTTYSSWRNETQPSNFHLTCYTEDSGVRETCSPWVNRGRYIDSGAQPADRETKSWFMIREEIVSQPASLSFEFRLDLEPPDIFAVLIDRKLADYTRGETTQWQRKELPVENSLCTWNVAVNVSSYQIDSACIFRNRFTPYKEANHFTYTPLWAGQGMKTVHLDNDGCNPQQFEGIDVKGKIVFLHRYHDSNQPCYFVTKGKNAEAAGAAGVLVIDDLKENPLIMTGNSTGLGIPVASMQHDAAQPILAALRFNKDNADLRVSIGQVPPANGAVLIQFVVALFPGINSTTTRRAYINEVSIRGTATAATECDECPPGFYSLGGMEQSEGCLPCPADHKSDGGSSGCIPCGRNEVAPPGSSACQISEVCTSSDFVPELGPCTGSPPSMTITWAPERCRVDSEGGAAQPEATSLACGPGSPGDCLAPGLVRDADGVSCKPCTEPNAVPNEQQTECVVCSGATIVRRVVDYSRGFAALNDTFPRENWIAQGWEFYPPASVGPNELPETSLIAGRETTSDLSASLSYQFTAVHEGSVVFTYRLAGNPSEPDVSRSELLFSVSSGRNVSNKMGAEVTEWSRDFQAVPKLPQGVAEKTFRYSFDPGNYTLNWEYRKPATKGPVQLLLTGITVTGAGIGVGSGCIPCPLGRSCEGGNSTLCDAGYYRGRDDAPDRCIPCPSGEVSEKGSQACKACPRGTTQEGPRPTACVLADFAKCTWTGINASVYNLESLERMKHPGDALDYGSFHLSLCKGGSGCPPGALACTTSLGGKNTSFGASLEVQETSMGLRLSFSQGDPCPSDHYRQLETVVDVVCDPALHMQGKAYTSHATLLRDQGSDPCRPRYRVLSEAGCALCENDEHLSEYWTPCVDGSQELRIQWGNCVGPKKDAYVGEKVRNCGEGAAETSHKRTGAVVAAVAASVIAVLCLSSVVVYLYRENTKLECKYQALQQRGDEYDDEGDGGHVLGDVEGSGGGVKPSGQQDNLVAQATG